MADPARARAENIGSKRALPPAPFYITHAAVEAISRCGPSLCLSIGPGSGEEEMNGSPDATVAGLLRKGGR